MKNVLKHKGYIGTVAFDSDDKIFYGRVEGITDIVSFEGKSVNALEKDFHAAVDDYLEQCADEGCEPQKPFSGKFNLRIDPSLHAKLIIKAKQENKSLNAYVASVLNKVA